MKENFEAALKFTFKWEGIHSDDEADPGGDTKFGIARNMHPEITDDQWQNFTIEDATAIYQKMYWTAMGCDDMPYPNDIAVFDCAVNPGPGACHHLYQTSINLVDFLDKRREYYRRRAVLDPNNQQYLKGWLNRVDDLQNTFAIT